MATKTPLESKHPGGGSAGPDAGRAGSRDQAEEPMRGKSAASHTATYKDEHQDKGQTSRLKPASTLASRLNRNFLWRLLTSFIFFDFVLLIIVVISGAYYAEKAALGSAWDIRMFRQLAYNEDLPGGSLAWPKKLAYLEYRITPASNRDDGWNTASNPDDSVNPASNRDNGGKTAESAEMSEAKEAETIIINAGPFAQTLYWGGLALIILEFLHFIRQYFKGKAANYRILEAPLQEMADQAELLSKFDLQQESYHDMENAIESLSPATPNAKIVTGDPNLEGLEDAINDLLARTHAAYQQQIRFVSDASHELRTPIAVIQGYADLLARWGRDDEAVLEEGITAIQAESSQMKALVEQLLFLARGDAGRNPMKIEELDLASLVREVAEEYRMIDDKHQWLVIAEQPVLAQGDRQMLKQVMRILVDNAKRYSPEGTEIRLKAFYCEGQRPSFLVQDMGTGIAREDLPKIFDRFYRSDPARKREGGGTGLGLAIAKWIVDSHQGHFTVLSREDLGTRITVVLPEYHPESAKEYYPDSAKESHLDSANRTHDDKSSANRATAEPSITDMGPSAKSYADERSTDRTTSSLTSTSKSFVDMTISSPTSTSKSNADRITSD